MIINKNISKNNFIKFKMLFTSLISPNFLPNTKLFSINCNNNKKLLLKQSYILLTWFYYLTFIEKNLNTKNNIKIFCLPIKKKKFTLTKAPMAHKN